MMIGDQVIDSSEDTDNLTYDWENSEILHFVKTFPMSDYGTKSNAIQTSEFHVAYQIPQRQGLWTLQPIKALPPKQ